MAHCYGPQSCLVILFVYALSILLMAYGISSSFAVFRGNVLAVALIPTGKTGLTALKRCPVCFAILEPPLIMQPRRGHNYYHYLQVLCLQNGFVMSG
jgi:hypothetical protein